MAVEVNRPKNIFCRPLDSRQTTDVSLTSTPPVAGKSAEHRNAAQELEASMSKDQTGDIARQAAAAPRTEPAPTPSTSNDPMKDNRFARMFGDVTFKPSENVKIFTNDRSGVKSKKLAAVLIELGKTGAYLKGSIYARQGSSDKKARAEFAWFGANMQTCIAADSAQAKSDLLVYQSHIANLYGKWIKENPEQAAAAQATGEVVELDGINLG